MLGYYRNELIPTFKMDIEDAEYQEWANVQEDCTTEPL